MELAAVGARGLRNAVFGLRFRWLHGVELQFFALAAAIDIHGQSTRDKIVQPAQKPAEFSHLQLFLANMGHFTAAADTHFPFHTI
ncbi:hypothetical protein BACCAP_02017 [Pseudoflavonifractor capillosus ATCC 29799]|uniref:Uncharacterized protein n=1 Tax=Pseudoflavonifractor capillosus ATCC 29799 TaxID=411467 RepID=A6NUY3_9FIRM|nr:hypothetical protein BACCAP_02017 [Pseudoflavonifractor capillosus ATCC 29799]